MIMIAACFPIETRWIRRTDGVRIVRVPMGARAPEGLPATVGGDGPRVLISAGFSGGLDAAARTGDLILADSIVHNGERLAIDARLLERARASLRTDQRRIAVGPTLCTDRVVRGPEEKRELGAPGEIAVDMESGPIARWAIGHGVPFLSVRVILDPLTLSVPFASGVPFWRSAIAHPAAAVRVARMASCAARALGPALADVADALEETQ